MKDGSFLYLKLYNTLKDELSRGVYPAGAKLPSEAEPRDRFSVSAITIKKAFTLLAQEGLVRRVPGKGTFAVGEKPQPPVEVTFTRRPRNPRLIGLLMAHASASFGDDILHEIDRQLAARGYKLITRYTYADRDRETEEIDFMLSLGVAGLLIMPCHGGHYSTTILRLILDNFPVVILDKKLDGIPVPSVRNANEDSMICLPRHLSETGCKSAGLVSVDCEGTTSLVERQSGFYAGLEETGMTEYPPCYVRLKREIIDNQVEAQAVEIMRAYLAEARNKVDALVCTQYGVVRSLVAAAAQEGIKLGPDGLRVCCVDEDHLAPQGYYFTHMQQDECAIGRKAVDLLFERLEGGMPDGSDYKIPAIFRRGQTT